MPKIYIGEEIESSTNGSGETGIQHAELDPYLLPCKLIISKWIKVFNKRPDARQEWLEIMLHLITTGKDFLNKTPVEWEVRPPVSK